MDPIALEVLNLDALVSSLKAAGIKSWKSETSISMPDLFPAGSKIIFFEGPSGESIELFEYSAK